MASGWIPDQAVGRPHLRLVAPLPESPESPESPERPESPESEADDRADQPALGPVPGFALGSADHPAVSSRGGSLDDALEFAASFPALYALAYKVAFRILGDRGDAEDAAQEALARTALRWDRLADRPEGWLVRVTTNLAIDRHRRRERARRFRRETLGADSWAGAGRSRWAAGEEDAGAGSRAPGAPPWAWAGGSPMPAPAQLAVERVDLVRALGALPRRQRTVVVLRYLADLSEADVAAEMGCSVGTVKSAASRALARLRFELQEGAPQAGRAAPARRPPAREDDRKEGGRVREP